MVRYLKWIIIIFGSIGICIASFFLLQNKHDIARALDYRSKIDYSYIQDNCNEAIKKYYFVCIKNIFAEYLSDVSFTGTNIGLKMVFNVIDKDKDGEQFFKSDDLKNMHYSINYLEINNLALNSAYRKYFGFDMLYGGFIATLGENYVRGFNFSENIILGLEGVDGIKSIKDKAQREILYKRLKDAKSHYYKIKEEVELFIDTEKEKLLSQV